MPATPLITGESIGAHLDGLCTLCGQGPEWNGKVLVLQLDHENGDCTDNRLENLRFMCPNCHSQTETFCRGMSRRGPVGNGVTGNTSGFGPEDVSARPGSNPGSPATSVPPSIGPPEPSTSHLPRSARFLTRLRSSSGQSAFLVRTRSRVRVPAKAPCGRGATGSARRSQRRGCGFEPRRPLHVTVVSAVQHASSPSSQGRFESGRSLSGPSRPTGRAAILRRSTSGFRIPGGCRA